MVGDEVYETWLQMLKALVPSGRTHRLAVVVAGMLAHASRVASTRRKACDENDPAYPLLEASQGVDEEEAFDLLKPMLVRLFKDAKVKHERVSRRGERYSILWEATIEFCRWYNYPWE